MRIAIVLFGKRISPHFGSSSRMMILEVKRGAVRRKSLIDIGGKSSLEMARRLVELKVKSLICGGIQRYCKEWLLSKGVQVMDNKKGEAEEFIKEILGLKAKQRRASAMGGI